MRRAVVPLYALCLGVVGPVAAAHAQETVLLRLAPEQGLVSRYVTELEVTLQSAAIPMIDPSRPMMTGRVYSTQAVMAVDGDVRTYRMVTDSTRMQSPAMPMLAQNIPDTDGVSQTLRMDTRGRIIEIEFEDETVPPEVKEAMSQIQGIFGGMGMELPENPIRQGESWVARQEIELPGGMGGTMSMQLEITYLLERVEQRGDARYAVLRMSGPMTMSGDQGQQGELAASGTMEGTIILDVSGGRLARYDGTIAMDVEAGAGMTFQTTQRMSMRLLDDGAG
jgi:hypothetical protein